jgi:hypothetical protein
MSTKCTIKYGDDFHFYNECFDDGNVYLELDNAEVEISGREVTLVIPKAIWAVIRESAPVDLPFAKMTDEEILARAEAYVDKRIVDHKAATTDGGRSLTSLFGFIPYGDASDPREVQIERGVENYKFHRKREKKILNKIRKYQRQNKR